MSGWSRSLALAFSGWLVIIPLGNCFAKDIQILWLAPRQDQEEFTLASSIGALALAVEDATREGLLHGYGVNITWQDSACDPKIASGRFVTYLLTQKPDVVFGPPCTKAMVPVSDLAAFMNVPIFSWVSNMHDLDNKEVKSTLIRAIAPLSSLGKLLIFFCEQMNWYRVSMIATEGERSQGMASYFEQTIHDNEKFYMVRSYNGVKENVSRSKIEDMFRAIKVEARIIVLVIPKTEVRRYMVAAYDLGMTNGDYQFLYTERSVSDKEFLDTLTSRQFWELGLEDDEKARRGYHNLLYFTYHYVTEWSLNTSHSNAAARRVFRDDPTLPTPAPPDKFSRFLYDAFYLYALAYNKTVYLNETPDGQNIFRASIGQLFQGQTGRFLMNDEADRQSSFLVWDMNDSDIFQQVVVTKYSREGLTWDELGPIRWGNGRLFNTSDGLYIPPDMPVCGFYNEKCPKDDLAETVAPSVIVSLMLAGFIAFLIIYRWWKNEKALYETQWKVKYTDLNFNIARGPISQAAMSGTTGSQKSLNDCSDNRSESSTGNMSSSCSTFRHDNMVMISQMFTTVAKYRGDQVAVRKVRKKSVKEDKLLLKEMKLMKSLKHTNLATFYGACTEVPNICVLWEYCSKGSLEDILHNTDIKLESMFQFSIALDICTGLNYLQTSELGFHGRLKTTNCVIDSRWVAKLTDFGLKRFKKGEKSAEEISEDKYYTDLLWTAPEVLRCIINNEKVVHTKEADIYSLGIVLKQLLCKNFAYTEEMANHTPKDIIMKIANPESERYMRPHISEEFPEHHVVMMSFVHLIKGCWAEDPVLRPNIKRVLRKMKRMSPLKTSSVLDNMLILMERYSTRLEDLVSERTLQLEEEKRKTDTLLYRMLPRKVADDLKVGTHVPAEAFPDVTIYFSDIVGFTTLASESTPMEIVEMLNLLYSLFDDIISNFQVYKVETIGDAYMVVCGCPDPNPDHARIMADVALTLLDSVIHFVIPHRPQDELRIRIGLNSGPVVAGVVGNTMPRYCLFGNTVNLASRMESQGMPQRIQISFFTHEILKNHEDFIIETRGLVEIKGKGMMPTYWLNGRKSTQSDNPETKDFNPSSSSHANLQDREIDGGDGDVTKQRNGRQSACEDGSGDNAFSDLTNSGVSETGNNGRSVSGDSPKLRSSRQCSGSSTSYTSFDNNQATLTSIVDIEEVSRDFGGQKRYPTETTSTGPNLELCLGNMQPGNSEGSLRNVISREQFWAEHFKNGSVMKEQVSGNSAQNVNNVLQSQSDCLEKDKVSGISDHGKDTFGMEQFGSGQLLREPMGQERCGSGSFDNLQSFDNVIAKKSVPVDITRDIFPVTTGNGILISSTSCDEKQESAQPAIYTISTTQGSKEGSPARGGNYCSTISINTGEGPCQINLNITPMPGPSPIPNAFERCNSHPSPTHTLNVHHSPKQVDTSLITPLPPVSAKYIQNADNNSPLAIESETFAHPGSKNPQDSMQYHPLSENFENPLVNFPLQSNFTDSSSVKYFCKQPDHWDQPESKCSPLSEGCNGLTIFDTDHIDTLDLNPFHDKSSSSPGILPLQPQKSDHYTKNPAAASCINNRPHPTRLTKKTSGKFTVHPTDKSRLIHAPLWPEKATTTNGRTKTYEVHLENQPKLRPHNRVRSSDQLVPKSQSPSSKMWRKSVDLMKSKPTQEEV